MCGFAQIATAGWASSNNGSSVIHSQPSVSAVVYRSPIEMVRTAQTTIDVRRAIDVDRGRRAGLDCREAVIVATWLARPHTYGGSGGLRTGELQIRK